IRPVVIIPSALADASFAVDEQDFPGACFLFSKDRFADDADGDPFAELARELRAAIDKVSDRRSIDERLGFVVGQTPAMKRVAETIFQAADSGSTVLVFGESGTEKELVARA